MSKPIQIWKFSDAPEEYRKHFNSDDADWLALIPKEYKEEYIGFLDTGSAFGYFHLDKLLLECGDYLKVGYHS